MNKFSKTGNYFSLALAAAVSVFGLPSAYAAEEEENNKEQTVHQDNNTSDVLPYDQQMVLKALSPLYKRIYLYALDEEQRERTAVFYKRGENPFRAIDNILRRDRKSFDKGMARQKYPPSCGARNTKRYYIISEEGS